MLPDDSNGTARPIAGDGTPAVPPTPSLPPKPASLPPKPAFISNLPNFRPDRLMRDFRPDFREPRYVRPEHVRSPPLTYGWPQEDDRKTNRPEGPPSFYSLNFSLATTKENKPRGDESAVGRDVVVRKLGGADTAMPKRKYEEVAHTWTPSKRLDKREVDTWIPEKNRYEQLGGSHGRSRTPPGRRGTPPQRRRDFSPSSRHRERSSQKHRGRSPPGRGDSPQHRRERVTSVRGRSNSRPRQRQHTPRRHHYSPAPVPRSGHVSPLHRCESRSPGHPSDHKGPGNKRLSPSPPRSPRHEGGSYYRPKDNAPKTRPNYYRPRTDGRYSDSYRPGRHTREHTPPPKVQFKIPGKEKKGSSAFEEKEKVADKVAGGEKESVETW